jgi:geranylgeranyl pyrophosphate synthase
MKIKKGIHSSDLKNGIATLPVIHYYRNSDAHEKSFLNRVLGKTTTLEDSEKLLERIENKGSIKYCTEKIKEREIEARKCLGDLPDNEFKKLLSDYLDYILKL